MHLRLTLLCSLMFVGTSWSATGPRTLSMCGDTLAQHREALRAGDERLQPALARLVREADRALLLEPRSVVHKSGRAASGDPHDYFSYGPYWWPNPDTADGLPYLRRDGQLNPAAREGTDSQNFARVNRTVETLGLAYFSTGHEPYAAKAAELTRTWYLAPATRMNPHLDYAQAIPGITVGRGIGVIESRWLTHLLDGLALLQGSAHWSADDDQALRPWMDAYYTWLRTSKNGRDEEAEHNNHGTFYDTQTVHLALYLGRQDEARQLLELGRERRVRAHIEPDGRQPHELERTGSLHYSQFNLEGLLQLSRLARHVGWPQWGFDFADHDDRLYRAVKLLAPYVDPARPWTLGEQINPFDRSRILPLIAQTLTQFAPHADELRPDFERHLAHHADALWRLWH